MKSENYQTLEFFIGGYRLGDAEQRSVLVTPNFSFTSPIVGKINFAELHHYNSVIRNHNEHQIRNITSSDDQNFHVEMDHVMMENSLNYHKQVKVILTVKFISNLIDSIIVKYDTSIFDQEIFKKILSPFTDKKPTKT